MAKLLKHVGRIQSSNDKVLIVFRTVPGDSGNALVIRTAELDPSEHDAMIALVESEQAQDAFEFGEILSIRHFPNGLTMLPSLHESGRLMKVSTTDVVVTPTTNSSETIMLSDLNVIIAEQKNCAVDELCNFVSGAPKTEAKDVATVKELGKDLGEPSNVPAPLKAQPNEILSDHDIAKSYRSQADAMYKEAARLRKQADELDPPAKKSAAKAKESVDA
jgi:hypothetical protein